MRRAELRPRSRAAAALVTGCPLDASFASAASTGEPGISRGSRKFSVTAAHSVTQEQADLAHDVAHAPPPSASVRSSAVRPSEVGDDQQHGVVVACVGSVYGSLCDGQPVKFFVENRPQLPP